MDRIRWGILATGMIARRFVEDLALLPDAEVAAVGSRSIESATAFANTHGIGRAHGSWQALAEDPDVDVIYVATPHHAHHPATSLCLAAGRAVLCEKPFTLDAQSSADLVERARAGGVFLMEAMWMYTIPAIRRVRDLIADGAIGEVTHLYADFGVQGPFPPEHRLRALELGGGALLDLGVYPISFAHLFLGVPDTVMAWASLYPEGSDRNTGVILGYTGGAVATLHSGSVGETDQRAIITGTTGRIELPRQFYCADHFILARDGQEERIDVPRRGNGMGYEAEEVMRCLRAGLLESPLVPLSGTLEIMRTLDAVRAQIGVTYPATPGVGDLGLSRTI